jgi:hypothetical protein
MAKKGNRGDMLDGRDVGECDIDEEAWRDGKRMKGIHISELYEFSKS